MKPSPEKLKQAIQHLLDERGEGKTICPSEVARAVAGSDDREKWEPLMQPVRDAAVLLVIEGVLDITQHGHVVDSATARGPIRLRRR